MPNPLWVLARLARMFRWPVGIAAGILVAAWAVEAYT